MFDFRGPTRSPLFGIAVLIAVSASACSNTPKSVSPAADSMPSMPGMSDSTLPVPVAPSAVVVPPTSSMPGMDMSGDASRGLAASEGGYTFDLATTVLAANRETTLTFKIIGPDAKPVTDYTVEQTKMLHFYVVRSDLTGYQHLHPQVTADGTWTVPVTVQAAGRYRVYADFTPTATKRTLVLSRQVTVPGTAPDTALPAPATTATVDGYTVKLTGEVMSGMSMPLEAEITRAGQPVTDLQPYLDSYAHMTALEESTLAFAHLHPDQSVAGSSSPAVLTFRTQFGVPGLYRLFIQFQTAGALHTAGITLKVNG